jgi:hypothetical protein
MSVCCGFGRNEARPGPALHTGSVNQSVANLYPDWQEHAARIRDGIAGLTAEALALRAGPDHAAIWMLAAHVAGTRAYWLSQLLGVHDLRAIDLWARRRPTE